MNNKTINIILISLLVGVSAVSIYIHNYYILVANVCVLGGVLLDHISGNMLLQENVNFRRARFLRKVAPALWLAGGVALIAWAYSKMLG